MRNLMIYGAYGYTGELIVRAAVERGHQPIIAGRSEGKLLPLAEELLLDYRAFNAEDAAEHLADVGTVLNCAGPFSRTAAPLVAACLDRKTHYVDITGEIPVFSHCHDLDEAARQAGVILCPGAGFDIVPTDCLAASLKERLPNAETINLAFSFGTKPSIGTAKTTLEALEHGGLVRRDHKLEQVGNAYDIRKIPFPEGDRWAATIPWGDVFTSGVSTGVPNGMVYAALPRSLAIAMRLASPFRGLLGKDSVKKRLEKMVEARFAGGPDDEARSEQRTEFWGEAIAPDGERVALSFSAPNVYSLTVDTAVEIAAWCQAQSGASGYATASMIMGADFITTRPGVSAMKEPPS
ncbi:trans-acting enoyl reductase family protein [Paracoccus sp. SCSIO 75233]|uniref:saccharopine dehydrogenase family protein n=1 Tax=Paracoccus sp. SCSIO 75233 TaxID=3017782 RepID=UPI0022F09D4E|nr:saccharopine dehydrogenase NADP-binding domain-containing protein [Paracoccus sp. SCSIO 75233]WBU54406.1 saccharopine dehydrogenase NADP-binding domain-containing protein [Paracoccus sp. SCSIO 75233]